MFGYERLQMTPWISRRDLGRVKDYKSSYTHFCNPRRNCKTTKAWQKTVK